MDSGVAIDPMAVVVLGLFAVVGNVFRVQVTTWWQRKKRDLM